MSVLYDYEIRNFMQNEKKTKKIKEEKNNRENTEIRRDKQASDRKLQKTGKNVSGKTLKREIRAAGGQKHPADARKTRDRMGDIPKKEKNRIRESGGQNGLCPYAKKCGGCTMQGIPYEKQLKRKEHQVRELLRDICPVEKIHGMENPLHYRNKVHAVFDRFPNGRIVSGIYSEGTHRVVPVTGCQIENEQADRIIGTIRKLVQSFHIFIYNEDNGTGLLRHVLVRCGHKTGQVMVVLVCASPIFPSKNNFVRTLRAEHPEITTVVLNVNDMQTSMVLGERNIVLYGKGYIEDELCGKTFRISPGSFYQINSVQTEWMYEKAIKLAGLTGKELVLDAYCGIGTIGIIASDQARQVAGVELNRDAVRDAIANAKRNAIKNIRFYAEDAGEWMTRMAAEGVRADVVFMDPPRSGSSEAFLDAVAAVRPKKIVYISCGPDSLARDLRYLKKRGYHCESAWPVDLFPYTAHTETVVLMSKKDT
ncbi:23S rRNA (uracil(1939)-C(5))-methyltransferase RlmD [Bilifractor porci]|nr:23S rRNA (uracil(1939)-C(5))-methyltransferase RlmD [Bilifractor porci]